MKNIFIQRVNNQLLKGQDPDPELHRTLEAPLLIKSGLCNQLRRNSHHRRPQKSQDGQVKWVNNSNNNIQEATLSTIHSRRLNTISIDNQSDRIVTKTTTCPQEIKPTEIKNKHPTHHQISSKATMWCQVWLLLLRAGIMRIEIRFTIREFRTRDKRLWIESNHLCREGTLHLRKSHSAKIDDTIAIITIILIQALPFFN